MVELLPSGSSVVVTDENKEDYTVCYARHRLEGRVQEQLRAMQMGLLDVVPAEILWAVDPSELEVLLTGELA